MLDKGKWLIQQLDLVGVTRFERATPASRRQCSTRLSYTPTMISHEARLTAKSASLSKASL